MNIALYQQKLHHTIIKGGRLHACISPQKGLKNRLQHKCYLPNKRHDTRKIKDMLKRKVVVTYDAI